VLTGREIAKLAGVSQATVSRVVLGSPKVRDATRVRVEKVMADVGYIPNAQASAMRTRRTGVIGVVTGQLTNPWYPVMLETLARLIAQSGLRMNVWVSDGDISDQSAIDDIRSRHIDGLIFTTATRDSTALPAALEMGLPLVLVNRKLDGLQGDQVVSDNPGGGRAVARYFLAHGKRDVVLVGGLSSTSTSRERRQGFIEEFTRAGIAIPPERMPESGFAYSAGLAIGRRIFARSIPQAAFCATDVIAFGVMDAAKEKGLRIPEDIWIVGYDDIPMASWGVLSLSSVRQPLELMARSALELLSERIAAPDAPFVHRSFDAELVVRNSTEFAQPT
jgi:LacI family transcriptional regulator